MGWLKKWLKRRLGIVERIAVVSQLTLIRNLSSVPVFTKLWPPFRHRLYKQTFLYSNLQIQKNDRSQQRCEWKRGWLRSKVSTKRDAQYFWFIITRKVSHDSIGCSVKSGTLVHFLRWWPHSHYECRRCRLSNQLAWDESTQLFKVYK